MSWLGTLVGTSESREAAYTEFSTMTVRHLIESFFIRSHELT